MKRLSQYLVQNSSTVHISKQKSNPPHSPFNKGVGSNPPSPSLLKAVYSSDLSRAVKSAEIIAEPYGIKPIIAAELRERNFGDWEGMSFDEIREKYPEAFNAWAENPLKFSPMQGEGTIEVRDRVIPAFNEIIEKHKGHYVAIVSHGGVNRILLCHLLGVPFENIFRIEQDFAALNIIEYYNEYPVFKLINFRVESTESRAQAKEN